MKSDATERKRLRKQIASARAKLDKLERELDESETPRRCVRAKDAGWFAKLSGWIHRSSDGGKPSRDTPHTRPIRSNRTRK